MKIGRAVSIAVICAASLRAQDAGNAFKSTRQIVFGVSVFDGGKYVSSFAAEDRKEMRLSAGVDHAVSVLLSDVYYWPIAAEYRADFQGVHIPLNGRLEVFVDDARLNEIPVREYLYYFPYGQEGEATRLLYGQEKDRFVDEYARAVEEAKAGRIPDLPRASFQGPFSGFILNLRAGKYRLVFSAEKDGRSFSMEKKLTVFDRKKRGISFQIIPEEKWTVSSSGETPHKRIYLKPGSVVFLKSFPASLYNRADYELMALPHRPGAGIGLSNSYLWAREEVSLEEDEDAALVLNAAGISKRIRPSGFLVKQAEGSALGYSIVEYDAERHSSVRPTFRAYRIPAPPPGIGVTLSLDGEGKDSVRHMRSLDPGSANSVFLLLLLPVPLLAIKRTATLLDRRRARRIPKDDAK